MYCSLWPARRGFAASVELPSMPWQAPQAAALPWPAVASPGFTAAVASAPGAPGATVAASLVGMPGVAGSAAGFAPGFAAVVAGAGADAGLAGAAVWAAARFMTSIAVMAAAACRNFISLSKGDASGSGALPHAPQPKDYEGPGRARSNRTSARPGAVSHTLPDYRFFRVAGYPFMSSNPLNSARFVLAANEIIQLPYDQGAEVAFA